jgi:hypothetical protein
MESGAINHKARLLLNFDCKFVRHSVISPFMANRSFWISSSVNNLVSVVDILVGIIGKCKQKIEVKIDPATFVAVTKN